MTRRPDVLRDDRANEVEGFGAPVVVTWVELSCTDGRAPGLASGPSVYQCPTKVSPARGPLGPSRRLRPGRGCGGPDPAASRRRGRRCRRGRCRGGAPRDRPGRPARRWWRRRPPSAPRAGDPGPPASRRPPCSGPRRRGRPRPARRPSAASAWLTAACAFSFDRRATTLSFTGCRPGAAAARARLCRRRHRRAPGRPGRRGPRSRAPARPRSAGPPCGASDPVP